LRTGSLFSTTRANVGKTATGAGKNGAQASVIRKQSVAPVVPKLQKEKCPNNRGDDTGQKDIEVDGLKHGWKLGVLIKKARRVTRNNDASR
jgi:hypothetical protein